LAFTAEPSKAKVQVDDRKQKQPPVKPAIPDTVNEAKSADKEELANTDNRTKKESQLAEQKRREGKGVKLDCFNLSIGKTGKIDSTELTVLSVLGEKKLLVAPIKIVGQKPVYGTYSPRSASQAIQNSLLNTHEEKGEPLMIYGWSSKGVVDGQKLILSETVEVIGTEQYKSVEGSTKTVFKLKVW
jgi:hypothetical protein